MHMSNQDFFQQITLLLVDDDTAILDSQARIMKRHFGKVLTAEDGREALDVYLKDKPDAVLTDIKMPFMNGLELAKEIKHDNRDVIIVILSAFSEQEMLFEAINIGVDGYFVKPVKSFVLIAQKIKQLTEGRFLRRQLMESLDRNRILIEGIEQSPVSFLIMGTEGGVEYANQKALDTTGYGRDEIIGKRENVLGIEHNSSDISNNLWTTVHSGKVWRGLLQNRRKNGETTLEETVIAPVINKQNEIYRFVVMKQDITELKAYKREVDIQKDRFQKTVENAPFPIMLHAEDGEVLLINKVWTEITGYDLDDIPTISEWVEKVNGEQKEVALSVIQNIFKEEKRTEEKEFAIMACNGKKRYWRFSSSPLGRLPDGRKMVVSMAIDLTVQRETEMMLAEQEAVMVSQSRQAAMGEMISMIAHQWRQPITAVGMSVNNILADIELDMLKPESIEECARTVMEQVHHLSQTIDDFRNFFKPEREMKKLSVNFPVESALKIINKAFENNNIQLHVQLESNAEVMIFEQEMIQVVLNLLNNARDAMEDKQVSNPEVYIRTYKEDGYTCFSISDNGGGVAESIRKKIFDPYFSTKEDKNGTGLGLYMSNIIVRKHHGGKIELHNTEKGACFTVKLPIGTGETNR